MDFFGTDGIRNRVGNTPFTLQDLPYLCYAIAQWLQSKDQKKVLIGCDTRFSGDWIKSAIISTLLAYDINVIDAGIIPTSGLHAIMVLNKETHYCIMISASHNYHLDNGIKILGFDAKISTLDEDYITKLFYQKSITHNPSYDSFGSHKAIDSIQLYHAFITSLFSPNFLHGITIALDCANGATAPYAPLIFKTLGANVITLHNTPNGTNINDNCGSQHPEKLQSVVKQHNALCGFAFDGDGDRVIAVNTFGEVKMGDDILALLSQHPRYDSQKVIVTTLMTNYGLKTYLERHDKSIIQTAVGDKHVLCALESHNAQLGGEQSGHIILRDISPIGDGIITALCLVESILHTKNVSMKTFTRYPQILVNLKVEEKKDLCEDPFDSIIKEHSNRLPDGRLIIRYSGTEKLLRVMVEDSDTQHAQSVTSSLVSALSKHLIIQ